MKKAINFIIILSVLGFSFLILFNPKACIDATAYGLVLCGRVLIPSLFPFTFCVLFILNSNILSAFKFSDNFLKKLFGMDSNLFSVFLLSLVGGYPIGAKLIAESGTNKQTSQAMLNYCVNAGPGFIITAIGIGIFSSREIGLLLFTTHIIPPVLMAFLFRKNICIEKETVKPPKALADNFVISAASSASALISICTFVILFSVITAYFNICGQKFAPLKPLAMLLEVTNSVSRTNNLLIIAFLLGFGGISIWCQVYSISKTHKPNIISFILCRIFHGALSAALLFIALKVFKITLPTVSNGKVFTFSLFVDTAAVGFSLIALSILFIISTKEKNYAGNILDDIV